MSENGDRSAKALHEERAARNLREEREAQALRAEQAQSEAQAQREAQALREERQALSEEHRARHDSERGSEGASIGLLDRETAPGLARLAANALVETGLWTVETGARVAKRLGQAATSPDSAMTLAGDAQREVATLGRKLLGIEEEDPTVAEVQRDASNYDDEALRNRWEDLLELSSDVETDEVDGHPAFADILTQLHPDEARILRLFASQGAQPAVDVRNWRPLGIGSHVVAPGLNMIGQHSGCLMVERVPVYLSNLFRLGLIWFSRDAIPDIGAYQVLEAQPAVTDALKRAGRGTTVRRSVQLTPFGEQFCAATLPRTTAEFEAISGARIRAVDEVPPPTEEPEPGLN